LTISNIRGIIRYSGFNETGEEKMVSILEGAAGGKRRRPIG